MDDDAEIIAEFLVESHENLDQLDRDLVELEQQPDSRERLSSIFRTIHTIKGTSGFLAFSRLERLTHVGETLLSRLRDGEEVMSPEIAEALLSMVDTVRSLLALIESTASDSDPSVDVEPAVQTIEDLLTRELPREASVAPVAAPEVGGAQERPDVSPAASSVALPNRIEEEEVAEMLDVPEAPEAPEVVSPPSVIAVDDEPEVTAAVTAAAPPNRVESSVRVDIDLLDDLVDLVGELVLTRNQILQRAGGAEDPELVRASQRLDLVASELQESVMKTRMQPIGQVWSKLPRVVRDLSHQLGREVELIMDGQDTELDRSLLEAVKDPLTHLVRNSLDHGIERPEDRLAAGKPAKGRLSLRAYHESGQVVVEIADDGKGIDPAKVGAVALERGVVTRDQLSRMEPREVLGLIFRPGFSTAAAVSNISGRGVGMDVVRTNIERIGGSVDVTSDVGRGTTTRVRIPLTLAIIPALVVGEGEQRYAIPQANLVELVRLEGDDLRRQVERLAGAPVLRLRGKLLPLVPLAGILGDPVAEVDELTIVVLQSDDVRFGLCVSTVFDTQEIVVKPIGRQLKGLAMYAGATIMGDGRVSLILDVAGVAATANVGVAQEESNDSRGTAVDDRTALLVLEVADGRRAALPLAAVARLEEFARDRIECSGLSEVVQYRDGILPLVRLATAIGLPDTSDLGEQVSVVVHETFGADGTAAGAVGIVIDKVLDVVEVAIVASQVGRRVGVSGSAIVQDRVTDLVDLEAVVARSGVSA